MATSKMQVLLGHFGCTEMSLVPRNAKWVDVAHVQDAMDKVVAYVADNDLGSRDWFGGIIRRTADKAPILVVTMRGMVEGVEDNVAFINNAKKLMGKK